MILLASFSFSEELAKAEAKRKKDHFDNVIDRALDFHAHAHMLAQGLLPSQALATFGVECISPPVRSTQTETFLPLLVNAVPS